MSVNFIVIRFNEAITAWCPYLFYWPKYTKAGVVLLNLNQNYSYLGRNLIKVRHIMEKDMKVEKSCVVFYPTPFFGLPSQMATICDIFSPYSSLNWVSSSLLYQTRS